MQERPSPPPLMLYHEPGIDRPEHHCAPRLVAVCSQCQRVVVFCILVKAIVLQFIAHTWRCSICEITPGVSG
jgi:hypothetical protein